MSKQVIPEDVKKQADEIVTGFNKRILKDRNRYYTTRYKGVFQDDWSGALNYEFNYRLVGLTTR